MTLPVPLTQALGAFRRAPAGAVLLTALVWSTPSSAQSARTLLPGQYNCFVNAFQFGQIVVLPSALGPVVLLPGNRYRVGKSSGTYSTHPGGVIRFSGFLGTPAFKTKYVIEGLRHTLSLEHTSGKSVSQNYCTRAKP